MKHGTDTKERTCSISIGFFKIIPLTPRCGCATISCSLRAASPRAAVATNTLPMTLLSAHLFTTTNHLAPPTHRPLHFLCWPIASSHYLCGRRQTSFKPDTQKVDCFLTRQARLSSPSSSEESSSPRTSIITATPADCRHPRRPVVPLARLYAQDRANMSAGHHDPRTLYTIDRIKAYHIQNGTESSLTPSGSQTMSLLMVPTSSPFADLSSTMPQNEIPEEDFYLHLHLPPELDLPLPATTQIYHQPPRNYLIPRWDMGPESGAFTRIEFPEKVSQDDIDTFETILAQCTAFLERAHPPPPEYSHKPYNPADWAQGKRVGDGKADRGQVVLIDEDDGSVVGQLADGAAVVEDPKLAHGSKSKHVLHN